ncbi:porphobilinogen synthase [Flavobacteriaceae bacterium]|jgi:porphobilinogen synthase|nr:porphobilinogen synthase [Flavobacteriaceae bacterium]MDA9886518.1 porphobilinogen synthase [Flavobacteriaceae bacterium]MDB2673089.1 porphobilinogen synthase [Flavobacteriaceae bacterium]MDB9886165.1 porphobilinogen synthase [Flavobacteriaceae bacterium]MDC0013959.1 porphobilinogen synthase [Flavobacteriaceae bacterium]
MYPLKRNRRLRTTATIRTLVQENHLSLDDLIVPIFVVEGAKVKEEIPSMPDYYRMSLDILVEEINELWRLGLKSVLLFVKVPDLLKDNKGTEALNPKGLMQLAIQTVKKTCPEMLVMTDVALDPYSSFGHDGIVEEGIILNDPTKEVLAKMALSHAQAGADFVAPSDMMDGRVEHIRELLEAEGFHHTGILSYSAKYASSFYGPFRDALDSAPGFGDKKTYQMDFHNRKEALTETTLDIEEGADIVMVKPGIAYLDIIRDLAEQIETPIAAYQVSGEYAMLKAAAAKGWIDYDAVVYEQLIAFKRAGASLIATYTAKDVARILGKSEST